MAALPDLTKTWYTQGNITTHASASTSDISKSFWFNIKTFLCNQNPSGTLSTSTGTRPSSSVWQVVSSSDGTSHGATDLWGTTYDGAKLNRANYNAAHSWIILKNTTNGYHIVLDMGAVGETSGRIAMASGTIAGGALTSPTTTSETFPIGNSSDAISTQYVIFGDSTIGAGQHYLHGTINDNGEFLILMSRAGQNMFHSFLGFVKLTGSHTSDTRNYIGLFDNNSSGRGAPRWSTMYGSVGYGMRRTQNGSLVSAGGLEASSRFGAGVGTDYGIDSLTNKYNVWQIEHCCLAPQFHYSGIVPDIYACTQAANCASVPSTSAQRYVLANSLLIPMIDVVPYT